MTRNKKNLRLFLINPMALQCFLAILVSSVLTTSAMVQEKADATMPMPTLSPPEGNTTFLDGTTWCIARQGVSPIDLQIALDWACGFGQADCHPIRAGGPCFEPNTLASHASYAFNSYYQQNGNNDIACHFGGTAALTKQNPSYDKCVYPSSGSPTSSGESSVKYTSKERCQLIGVLILVLLYRTRN